MKVIWQDDAKKSLRQISRYIGSKFGNTAKLEFVKTVDEYNTMLSQMPYLFAIEPLFDDRSETYRSVLIANRSRLVYRVDGDVVNVVAFWDCRSNTKNKAKKVK